MQLKRRCVPRGKSGPSSELPGRWCRKQSTTNRRILVPKEETSQGRWQARFSRLEHEMLVFVKIRPSLTSGGVSRWYGASPSAAPSCPRDDRLLEGRGPSDGLSGRRRGPPMWAASSPPGQHGRSIPCGAVPDTPRGSGFLTASRPAEGTGHLEFVRESMTRPKVCFSASYSRLRQVRHLFCLFITLHFYAPSSSRAPGTNPKEPSSRNVQHSIHIPFLMLSDIFFLVGRIIY